MKYIIQKTKRVVPVLWLCGILLYLLTISGENLNAQNLYIEIYDPVTYRPIPEALILLESDFSTARFYTSAEGYVSQNIPAGNYRVTFSHPAYQEKKRNIIVATHENFLLSIYLQPASVPLNLRSKRIEPAEDENLKNVGTDAEPLLRVSEETVVLKCQNDAESLVDDNDSKSQDRAEKSHIPLKVTDVLEDGHLAEWDYSITRRDYLRPSVTYIYIDRGEEFSDRFIRQLISNGISGKFDDNSVPNHILKTGKDLSAEDIHAYIEEYVARDILRVWFPYDKTTRQHRIDVVAHRGMYDAVDADVNVAQTLRRGDAALRDAGFNLIDKSYIVVYDPYNIRKNSNRKTEGYQASCNVYVFKLDWNRNVATLFYNNWENPDAIDQITLPVKNKGSFQRKSNLRNVSVSQDTRRRRRRSYLSDEQLFAQLTHEVSRIVDTYITKENSDFQVRTGITNTRPVRAAVGRKEGVTVDQRYFAYEMNMLDDGQIRMRRRGVVRATRRIAENEMYASGNSETTRFYQTYGGRLNEGLLIQQCAYLGLGVSVTGGTDFNILIELLRGVVTNSTSSRDRVKFYLRVSMYDPGPGLKEYMGIGISREFYFGRIFSVTPFVGNTALLSVDNLYGLDAGFNTSISILHNFQIITNAGLNTLKLWGPTAFVNLGGGLRVQF